MAGRRMRRPARPNPKPYGFCCNPADEVLPRHGLETTMASITSLHECPALKIREQEIVKRPRTSQGRDGVRLSHSALQLGLPPAGSGGMKLNDMTESMIDFMIDTMRAQRQAEYEERMDRLAAIGERKTKERKMRKLKCGPPCWYTDYSLAQLQHLKDLEDAMFKDKKENTINRTAHCLAMIGMTTDFVTVDAQVLRKLMNEYSTDMKTFICEVYKAIRGNYFEDEGIRLDYTTHERIMISGVVFLELPQVILELHKRLPAIIRFKFPERPKAPTLKIAKKMCSPLIEKLYPAVNWRLYATRLLKWRKKCLEIPRPVAILPKETKEPIAPDDNEEESEEQKTDRIDKSIAEKSRVESSDGNEEEKNDTSDTDKSAKKDDINGGEGHDSDTPLFEIENPWTEPPTPCPMKYIKRLRENPLKTDSEFFSQLNRPPGKSQVSPSFRLQSVLLEAEAELYGLVHEAKELTGEVTRLAKEILEPDLGCDPCCSCKQTRRAHLMMHATKAPHAIVDGVVTDENDKTQVIGAMAMHSPAESIASENEPPVVPSHEKLVKNKVVAGPVTMIDGQPVRQIVGITKTLEHISQEVLLPDVKQVKEVKNVPPCGCRKKAEDEEFEKQVLSTTKDEGLCYGKKYRPKEGPTYTCPDFGKKDEEEDCGCGEDVDKCDYEDECVCEGEYEDCFEEEDDCGCGDDADKCAEDVTVKKKKIQGVICKRCGRQLDTKCVDKARKADRSKSPSKGKKVTNKCSCDSLSEFLQMDLGKAKCVLPKKEYYSKKDAAAKEEKSKKDEKAEKKEKSEPKPRISRVKSERSQRSQRSVKNSQVTIRQQGTAEEKDEEGTESSEQQSVDEGGPYGYRTKSEEALPIERTLMYLTDVHPPMRPAERIPVRKGGRPCCCRRNRNNRKTLLYGIGALIDEEQNDAEAAEGTRLIEGVTWVTPDPSIRGSDEYIPEYELWDSPYEKQICGVARKVDKKERALSGRTDEEMKEATRGCPGEKVKDDEEDDGDRKNDWENAIKDDYLTEFFTKDRDGIPCWTNCAKFRKKDNRPRLLKVMKPVCECKYERRIVKRNEERQKWRDRQQRLKSLDKESFLHIDDMAEPQLSGSDVTHAVTVISAVTMQTPCDTPQIGMSRSHLPYEISVDIEMKKTDDEPKDVVVEVQKAVEVKDAKESGSFESKKVEVEKEAADGKKKVDTDEMQENDEWEDEVVEIEFTAKMAKCTSFFDKAEEELTALMNAELEKMAVEDNFVSLKLPNYHKLAQLSYWISYRVRGMCFTEKYKKDLMLATTKIWNSRALINKPSVESLRVKKKDRCKLNFDHAKYWKRKIGKLTRKFYAKTRQESIEIGRELWPTMEFGKFPHLLFKQAYYTYLPPREVDIYAFRTYFMK